MYGLISNLKATAGDRDQLIQILLEGTQAMPGCLQYVVSADAEEADGLWVTEVWETEAAHQDSLKLPRVQAAIAAGRPLIAGMGARHVVTPVGGVGIG